MEAFKTYVKSSYLIKSQYKDASYVLKVLEEADADLLFIAHSHKPYHRILATSDGRFKHVINLGLVGKPKDGDSRGCYVMLNIYENSST